MKNLSRLLALLFLLLISQTVQASPRKRVIVKMAIEVGDSIVQNIAVSHCQSGQFERCNEGYGSRRAFALTTTGIGFGTVGLSELCEKEQPHWWFCKGLAIEVPAVQLGYAIHDFAAYRQKEVGDAKKIDLSGVVLIHR